MSRVHAPLLAGLILLAACSRDGAPELLDRARQAIEAQDLKAAQIHLKNALQQDVGLAEARFLLGKLLLQQGDAQGALVEFGKAREAGFPAAQLAVPHAQALFERAELNKLLEQYASTQLDAPKAQAELLLWLGRAQQRLGQTEAAKASFERALGMDADNGQLEVELARLSLQAGQADEALTRLERLLERQPKLASAWRLKGDLLAFHRRDPAAARQALERAVQEAPRSAETQLALVAHLLEQRDLAAAEQQLGRAKAQLGGNAGVRYYAAVLHMEQGKLDAAHEETQQLLKLAPDDARLHFLAGQIEFLRDRFLQAESHLTRSLVAPAMARRGRLLLAQTYLRLDDPARSLQTLQPLLDDATAGAALPRAHALAGEAYLVLGETRKAEEQFKRAAALDPKDMRSRTLLALGQVHQGQDSRGLGELRDLSESFESPLADLALVATFIRKGDHAEALKAIDAIERKLPDRGVAPALRAQVYRAQGKEAQERAAYEDALRRDPKYLPAAVQLARIDLQNKQPQAAAARLEAVVKADPGNAVSRLAWLQLRQQAGEAEEAIEKELRKLIGEQPQVVRARTALVRHLLRRGDLSGAAASVQEATAALPNEPDLHELQAELQLRQREPALAMKSMQRSVELRPRNPDALLRLADLEQRQGRAREAMASVRKALAINPRHGQGLRMQIGLEAELGNVASARRLVKDMAQLQGLEALAAATEGDLEASQQQHELAASAYRRALARNAALPEVPAKLHRSLRAAGKVAEAEAFARDWFKDHPRDHALLNYLGDAALNENRPAEAKGPYERSLALQPEQPLVLNNLAWIALQQGELKLAEQRITEALRLAPGEAALHDTQAALLSALGRHEQAQAAQRRAQQLDANPVFRVGLAKRLVAAGRKDAARDELLAVQQLRDRYPGQAEVSEMLAKL